MLIDGEKWACEACVRGHRVSNCQHHTRPLQHINKKGRPVSQCPHCRGLRKSRSSHVKCECGNRPGKNGLTQPGDPNKKCSCSQEKRCTCALKKELLGPLGDSAKRSLKRARSSTDSDTDKVRPRGLSATHSDPALNLFKRHKPMHRYSQSGQESSMYHAPRPHSMHGLSGYPPGTMDGLPLLGAAPGPYGYSRPRSLQGGYSPSPSESVDSLHGYDLQRPAGLQGLHAYNSADGLESFTGTPYDIPRPRSIQGQSPYIAKSLDRFPQYHREGTPHLYTDNLSADPRQIRSAHTSPAATPVNKLEGFSQPPHLEIPYATFQPSITSSPVGGDEYGVRVNAMPSYVEEIAAAAAASAGGPNNHTSLSDNTAPDWTALDLPLHAPGTFSAAPSHPSSYASFDPHQTSYFGSNAVAAASAQPGLTDASSGEVSEAEEYAHHSVASPSVAGSSPFVQPAEHVRGGPSVSSASVGAAYGLSGTDAYADLNPASLLTGHAVDGLGVEPYLHRGSGSPVDMTEFPLGHPGTAPKMVTSEGSNNTPYGTPPPANMGISDAQRLSPFTGRSEPGDGHAGHLQPTSDPSWADANIHESAGAAAAAAAANMASNTHPTSNPANWGSGSHLPHHHHAYTGSAVGSVEHGGAIKMPQHINSGSEAGWPLTAEDARSVATSTGTGGGHRSRHSSPLAQPPLQPTSDPSWARAAGAGVGAAPTSSPRVATQAPSRPRSHTPQPGPGSLGHAAAAAAGVHPHSHHASPQRVGPSSHDALTPEPAALADAASSAAWAATATGAYAMPEGTTVAQGSWLS